MASLREKLTLGAVWTVSFRVLIRFMGVISTAILARLLVPADFGLVTLAATTIAIANAFTEFSPEQYLLTHDCKKDDYDTAWTLQLIRGVAICILMFIFAESIAQFFNEPRLELVISLLAIGLLFRSSSNIAVVDFRKNLDFRSDFKILFIPKLAGFFVTIALAFTWRSYWALICGLLAGQIAYMLASYRMHNFRPSLGLPSIRKVFGFSKWMFINSILQFILQKFDTFLIGRALGTQSLGYYAISYEISTLATSEIAAPIRRAALPGYSKIAVDKESLKGLYLDVFSLTIMITVPIALGIMATSDLIVLTLLGPNWAEAIPVIEVLALVGLLQAIGSGSGPLFLAAKCPRNITLIMLGTLLVQVPLMLWAIEQNGIIGVAWALVAAWAWRQILNLYFVMKVIDTGLGDHFSRIWRSLLSALAMYGILLIFRTWLPSLDTLQSLAGALALCVALGAIMFCMTHFTLWVLCGRPNGTEAHAFRVFTLLLNKTKDRT